MIYFWGERGVSIHALLAECDGEISRASLGRMRFNPRTPCGVRPPPATPPGQRASFNPRTPCGVRQSGSVPKPAPLCFNPRTPCGVRQWPLFFPCSTLTFQSTHSLRSATSNRKLTEPRHIVSIHALLAECDYQWPKRAAPCLSFQSTHSLRSATNKIVDNIIKSDVSIHALLAECDPPINYATRLTKVSIHALLAECDAGGRYQ